MMSADEQFHSSSFAARRGDDPRRARPLAILCAAEHSTFVRIDASSVFALVRGARRSALRLRECSSAASIVFDAVPHRSISSSCSPEACGREMILGLRERTRPRGHRGIGAFAPTGYEQSSPPASRFRQAHEQQERFSGR